MSQHPDTWQCGLCNYINLSCIKLCEMCDASPSNKTELQHESSNVHNKRKNPMNREVIQPIYTQYNKQSHSTYYNTIPNNDDDSKNRNLNIVSISSKQSNSNNNINTTNNQSVNTNQWQCTKCTYSNHTDLPRCEVCLSKRDDNSTVNNQITDSEQSKNNNNNASQYKLEYKQEHKDTYIAQSIQQQEAERMKQYYVDLETAKQLAKQMELEQNTAIAHQMQVEEQQRMKQFYHDINAAKQLEQKYQSDEIQFQNDRQIALKMQKEFAQGLAWFCASCFTMNLNVESFECDACGTKRPKPKIRDVLTVRDQVAMKMIEMLRNVAKQSNITCIVNLAFAQHFVTKYLQMCKQRGLKIAKPQICYHWTRKQFFEPIKQTGLKVPDGKKVKHMTDTGYYGKGIYMSPDPKYAQGYGYGAKLFFAALSLTGKQYSAKYPRDLGCSLKDGYDSHFSSDRINAQTGIPNEWIFFKPQQLLLCFHISLDQVQYVIPVFNQVINYLLSKYDELNKKGGIRGL